MKVEGKKEKDWKMKEIGDKMIKVGIIIKNCLLKELNMRISVGDGDVLRKSKVKKELREVRLREEMKINEKNEEEGNKE